MVVVSEKFPAVLGKFNGKGKGKGNFYSGQGKFGEKSLVGEMFSTSGNSCLELFLLSYN